MDTATLTPALFESLKTGQIVRVTYTGGMLSATAIELKVGRRSRSKKYGVDSLTLNYQDGRPVHPTANRIQLHKRTNRDGVTMVTMGLGDMGVSVKRFEVVS